MRIGSVYTDPVRFAQVLVNFISNAVRFTENAPTWLIEVTLDASEEVPNLPEPLPKSSDNQHETSGGMFLMVSVKDSGIGLTKEERTSLFNKFVQASPKTYSQYGGSGLGLFISRKLVEVQGGRVSLQSSKGEGTTVSFYIRCKQSSTSPSLKPKLERVPTSPPRQPAMINVLVVEDNLVL